jgi:hypothetical protein
LGMGTEQESKSTRFSRWRERRRREKVRASEIKRELKTERARRSGPGRHGGDVPRDMGPGTGV